MKRILVTIGLVLVLTAMFIPSVPVFASSGTSNAPLLPITRSTDLNWSGYAEAQSYTTTPPSKTYPEITGSPGSVTDVQGSWKVPTVTGTRSKGSYYSSAWVGIDGYSDTTVEQTGTEQDWSNGRASYYAWFEMYPNVGYELNPRYFPVKPGDVMTAEVKYVVNNTFDLYLNDTTEHWSFNPTAYPQYAIQTLSGALEESAEWIMEAPSSYSGVLPLADFGTISFASCSATIGKASCSINTDAYDAMTMVSASGANEAVPGSLSNDGKSFSVTWVSSGATHSNLHSSYQHVHIR